MKKAVVDGRNVYELTQERLKIIFKEFDNIYISFSGGKDSGVLLNLCIDYIRKNNLKQRLGVFDMDYEIQYRMTIDYVDQVFQENQDILDIYRVCVPFRVPTCTSMYQAFWRPWDPTKKDLWVRPMPADAYTTADFPFYNTRMSDYDFQVAFGDWYHERMNAVRTCCLIGIRTQESFSRWRSIYSARKVQMYHRYRWTTKIGSDIFAAYPIYDWKTEDVWVANGKFKWTYNHLYDLFYQAGVELGKQRVASPFLGEARESLSLYKVIDPDTWGRMIGRVNGVNFTGIYGGTHALGWHKIKLPTGYTWRDFMYFLLSTLPERAKNNYLKKFSVSVNFWRKRGGVLHNDTIKKLQDLHIPIIVMNDSIYKTNKKPVRMEYLDDINIPEFREIPTYKRMCLCILKNDHTCKYMGFAQTKEEVERRTAVMEQYNNLKL
jgi:predicted phosphoadenosine phosphosulfate sulfurtransferase